MTLRSKKQEVERKLKERLDKIKEKEAKHKHRKKNTEQKVDAVVERYKSEIEMFKYMMSLSEK